MHAEQQIWATRRNELHAETIGPGQRVSGQGGIRENRGRRGRRGPSGEPPEGPRRRCEQEGSGGAKSYQLAAPP